MKHFIIFFVVIFLSISFAGATELVCPDGYELYDVWYDGALIIGDENYDTFYYNGTNTYPIISDSWSGASAYYNEKEDIYVPLEMYSAWKNKTDIDHSKDILAVPYYESIKIGEDWFGNPNYGTQVIIPAGFTGEISSAELRDIYGLVVDVKNPKYAMIGEALYDKTTKTLIYYGVKKIPSSGFSIVAKYSTLTIPEGILEIGPHAFQKENYNVSLPSTLKNIDKTAFADFYPHKITLAEGSDNYMMIDGVLYTSDLKTAIMSDSGQRQERLVMPETVTEVYPNAYRNVNTSIRLSPVLESVGDYAFLGTTINAIPQTLKEIGISSFYNATIESGIIEVPGTLEHVREQAFMRASAKTAIIHDGVKILNTQSFAEIGLTDVDFGSTVVDIYKSAFEDNRITVLNLPDTVEYIGSLAFADNRIEKANIPLSLESIAGDAISLESNLTITMDESHPLYEELSQILGPYLTPSWL
ncbi:MAG TPA: leucine-rich repeat domain-containing protein [Candidatus Ornithospirochaeta avicola]|uniref:Leucine-rich repeat domain-containing protein n=1 Tax=Candidatus Ornithospirochaeta avicola TaxID=2840896 RepID=A0A9D1TNA4_9SPIO|nr:leucine-rich repeat domain-containing protein [Candidatus Ornithospirochaeta avicola]